MVIVEVADPSLAIPLQPDAEPLVESATITERNLVYAQGTARLRLCVRLVPARAVPAISIPCDATCALRLAATSGLQRVMRGDRIAAGRTALPTTNQRMRYIRLLRIHDALEAGASARDLAFGLVFPNHRPLAGAIWKCSGERRHVLRLIADARRLVATGYRRLLLHR